MKCVVVGKVFYCGNIVFVCLGGEYCIRFNSFVVYMDYVCFVLICVVINMSVG